MRSADEAKAYVTKLRTILRYLGTCDGNMEQGSLRADVNVSVRRLGEGLGTRCEIKNVNSIRFIGQAIEYEARRQIGILEDGGKIDQETRLFDPNKGETRSMRSKEEAHDYRYFPDPDLLPLEFDQTYVDDLAAHLPELPDAKRARFIADYGLPAYDATVLVADKQTADYYEAAVAHGGAKRDAKAVANWVMGDVSAYANSIGIPVSRAGIATGQVAELVDRISDGTISGKIAKDVLVIVIEENRKLHANPSASPVAGTAPTSETVTISPTHSMTAETGQFSVSVNEIIATHGLQQVTDLSAIEAAVDQIIAANPDKVAQALAKPSMLGWFVGQVMKQTGGKANPQAVNELLKTKLGI